MISTQPVNSTACPGKAAILSIYAQGNFTSHEYQNVVWKRSKLQSSAYETLASSSSKYIFFISTNIERTTLDAVLRIRNVTVDDERWYFSEVGDGRVATNRAYLNVITAAGKLPYVDCLLKTTHPN